MTDLESKADTGRDIVRASEVTATLYRLETTDLKPADAVGDDDFPQYGDFADVTAVDGNGDDLGKRWIEVPGGLARAMVDAGIEAGDEFQVTKATKAQDGAWTFEVETDD